MAEIELGYDFLGARLTSIGPFEVQYRKLLSQPHRVGSLDVLYERAIRVAIGPAQIVYDRKGSRVKTLGEWTTDYDWLGTRLRRIGPYELNWDWGGSRVRDVGPMYLEYSRGGKTPERVRVPDEDVALPEEHLIVLFHILMEVQTGEQ
jgi:hypothetical protein